MGFGRTPYRDVSMAERKLIVKLTDQPYRTWSTAVRRASSLFFPMEVRADKSEKVPLLREFNDQVYRQDGIY